MKHILMISNDYPTADRPAYVFVDRLARAFADEGVRVSVISPYFPLKWRLNGLKLPPAHDEITTAKGATFSVYRPKFVSASKSILCVNTARISLRLFTQAVYREIRARNLAPDILYGHFIAMSGLCASELGERLGIPSFLAYGESSPENFSMFGDAFLKERLSAMRGVISVSSENKRRLAELHYYPDEDGIRVIPNAIDPEVFYPADRAASREALGFPKDAFIVAFVGSFISRKGVPVLEEAIGMIPDAKALFIGQGPRTPAGGQVLFAGPVANSRIYQYLSSADAFALPTLNEGLSNAIVEAMACGLPIVSSDLPFNDDILTDENSLRIDPTNARQVADALLTLKQNLALRKKLSDGALLTARSLTIKTRAINILSFMLEDSDGGYQR